MGIKSAIKRLPGVGHLIQEAVTRSERERYEREKLKRIDQYGPVAAGRWSGVVGDLRKDGIAILRQVVPKETLLSIRAEFERALDEGKNLLKLSKDSARKPGDLSGTDTFLTPGETASGQAYFRDHCNFAAMSDPLLHVPGIIPIALDESLTRIAAEYFGCPPALGSLNLRKSFVNSIPDFDTLYFHCDGNCPDFLKFFFYLNDVDREGGPFCFIRGSHRKRFPGWRSKYRWTHDEIAAKYPAEDILFNTAQVGDLIIANTTGFHRGTKVVSRDRSMLTLDYVVHEEYWGKAPRFKIRKADLAGLAPGQQPLADFLVPVD